MCSAAMITVRLVAADGGGERACGPDHGADHRGLSADPVRPGGVGVVVEGVVLQPQADGQIGQHGDAQGLQVRGRAHPEALDPASR